MEPAEQSRLEASYFDKIQAGEGGFALQIFWDAKRKEWGEDTELVQVEWPDAVMHRAMNIIEQGFYPPPEMLLVMLDCYREYLKGEGAVSLEAAMLGAPLRKVGTVANREAKRRRTLRHDLVYSAEFLEAQRAGLSDNKAAEAAQAATRRIVGWATDSSSWLSNHRRAVRKGAGRLRVLRTIKPLKSP